MKIARATLRPFAARLEREVAAGRRAAWRRVGALLVLEDERGTRGVGELSPLRGFSPDRFRDAWRAARELAGRLAGAELPDADLGNLLAAAVPEPAALPASCAAALETALADLLARRAGVPLHALLAPGRSRPPRAVPVAALLPHTSLQEMVEGAFRAIGRGVRTLKAKLGPGGETVELCARLEVLRRKVGMDIALRADINGAWPLEQAGELMHMLATSGGPELCEQPVAPPHLASLPDPPLPIAADESLMYETAREEALERAPISAVVLKPMTLGGLRASMDLARRARERGLDVIVSHLHGGPVAHAMACELALALDPPPLPCGLDTGPALDALGGPPPQWRAAWIVPVDRPGLGIDTDRPEAGA